jgi:hypothetical protein
VIIPTKYNVGHTFWVPRSMDFWTTEELRYEGEVWKRKVQEIRPSVKQKKIIGIDITVNKDGKVMIQYYTVNVGNEDAMSQVHREDAINNYTEEEALAIAKDYADRNETYYGN